MSDPGPGGDGEALDAAAFWQPGPLPTGAPDPAGPGPATGPATGPQPGDDPPGWLGRVGRPEITVDGRNLADVLAPLYRALTDP